MKPRCIFIFGTFRISEALEYLEAEVEAIGGVSLVLVDTSSAYFEGEDENNNHQAGTHARLLRDLTNLSGGPCVIVACHPPKNANEANLQPRGGGAFIAEMDGNLTAKNDEGSVDLHWQGKFRGPDFAPISFELRQVTHQDLKDQRGRLLPTIVARHLSEIAKETIAKANDASQVELLKLVAKHPKASLAELANMVGAKGPCPRSSQTAEKPSLQRDAPNELETPINTGRKGGNVTGTILRSTLVTIPLSVTRVFVIVDKRQ